MRLTVCVSSSLCLRPSDRPSSLASASLSFNACASRSSCSLSRASSLDSCSHCTSTCTHTNRHTGYEGFLLEKTTGEGAIHILNAVQCHTTGKVCIYTPNVSLTLALYRLASSAISTACLTCRQADHSLCWASCWLARTPRRATSNSSRSLKDPLDKEISVKQCSWGK